MESFSWQDARQLAEVEITTQLRKHVPSTSPALTLTPLSCDNLRRLELHFILDFVAWPQVTVCRLYSSCRSLVQEVNSHGELFGVIKTRACLIADPESCLGEIPAACSAAPLLRGCEVLFCWALSTRWDPGSGANP